VGKPTINHTTNCLNNFTATKNFDAKFQYITSPKNTTKWINNDHLFLRRPTSF